MAPEADDNDTARLSRDLRLARMTRSRFDGRSRDYGSPIYSLVLKTPGAIFSMGGCRLPVRRFPSKLCFNWR